MPSSFRVVHDYATHPPSALWRAVTDPAVVPLYTQGTSMTNFAPVVGAKFQYVTKTGTLLGMVWRGVVDCVVLEVQHGTRLSFSWQGDEAGQVTHVTVLVEPLGDGGARLVWEHTGFKGVGGFFMCRLLEKVRKGMLHKALPKVLDELDKPS